MYQYVDGGLRYLPGEWGTEDRLFDPANSVTSTPSDPPGEEPGTYPSPAEGSTDRPDQRASSSSFQLMRLSRKTST